eukprot:TRINITY_DN2742_c0_g1_i2.p1 TRINITY_DN2742_c0_g1~~TRINITY_DN2742_c0_g1_i2.p1  ORF type:complete len:186 (-),score=36.75 TRINITY_DN2742_c0_g1_i2:56-613(-)
MNLTDFPNEGWHLCLVLLFGKRLFKCHLLTGYLLYTRDMMATEAADSDEEYLYGREGQSIPTPPPVTALEESAPLSSEMAELEVNDNNTPREISEIPADEPEPVEERPATTEPLPVPTPSNESILSLEQIKAERASLSPPDNNIAVVLQSPPTALLTNEGMLLNICLTSHMIFCSTNCHESSHHH